MPETQPKSKIREHCQPLHSGTRPICLCYVLSYRAPQYIRTRTLLAALQECANLRVVTAINTRTGIWRYVETFFRILKVRRRERPDIYMLGFRGHEIFWPVKVLARGKPLILDALMSPYAAMKEENKKGLTGRWLAPLVFRLESNMLHHADAVLTDTRLHASFLAETFGLVANKVIDVPIGAVECASGDQEAFKQRHDEIFSVLFYGSFLALHGVDVILEAAARLKELPIRFDFVGGAAANERDLRQRGKALGVTRFTYRRWVPFEKLLQVDIPSSDLCLGGPFGTTPQASRVVTGKSAQCMSLGKPTVVGEIDEQFGFLDRVNCLLVKRGDPVDLSKAIRWAYEHRDELAEMGRKGRDLYLRKLSIRVAGERLGRAIDIATGRQPD